MRARLKFILCDHNSRALEAVQIKCRDRVLKYTYIAMTKSLKMNNISTEKRRIENMSNTFLRRRVKRKV
jgi:hypothetical protein